jgi:hypothetical protein
MSNISSKIPLLSHFLSAFLRHLLQSLKSPLNSLPKPFYLNPTQARHTTSKNKESAMLENSKREIHISSSRS